MHDVMHQKGCIEDVLKHSGTRNLSVSRNLKLFVAMQFVSKLFCVEIKK